MISMAYRVQGVIRVTYYNLLDLSKATNLYWFYYDGVFINFFCFVSRHLSDLSVSLVLAANHTYNKVSLVIIIDVLIFMAHYQFFFFYLAQYRKRLATPVPVLYGYMHTQLRDKDIWSRNLQCSRTEIWRYYFCC